MRFFVDENFSPLVADLLVVSGHDAVHVRDMGLASAQDGAILEATARDDRTVVSADTDFGTLLARDRRKKPSVVVFRRLGDRRHDAQAPILLDSIDAIEPDLTEGAIVVFTDRRIRVRRLPLLP